MPWPRLRMWPRPAKELMVASVTSRILSGGASKTAGSTLPWRAIFGPSVVRMSARSTRQSTLSTFAPERATAERKCFVVWEIQLTTPGVEELHGGGSSCDLCFQIGNGGLSDAMEECAEDLRLVVEETLDGCESFLSLAFHHITAKRPRSTGKAQDGNFGTDGFHDTTDGFGEKGRLFLRVEDL